MFTIPVTAQKSGRLEGTIVGRDPSKNTLTVQHAEVPGVMMPMTMGYEVRGQKVTALPANGARVTGVLHEANGKYWLTDVKASGEHAMGGPAMQMQHEHGAMGGMKTMTSDATSDFLMRQASGTSMNPAGAPMHMTMTQQGDWRLMLHGLAFINQVVQSGPRGEDKLFSTNWVMGMADRP